MALFLLEKGMCNKNERPNVEILYIKVSYITVKHLFDNKMCLVS